jgi:hypothetical protein
MNSGAQAEKVGWVLRECSWCWCALHSRRFLESVPWDSSFTWLLKFLESVLPGAASLCHCSGWWRLASGVWSPSSMDIWWRVDRSGTCIPVLSCQTDIAVASCGPDSSGAYQALEGLGRNSQEPGHIPSRVTRLGRNRWPSVPWVQESDSSARAFRQVGDRSRSLDRRQNRYSHVTAGTFIGWSCDHGASRYDRSHDVRS